MSYNPTRWIEDAEARRYHETARFDRVATTREKRQVPVSKALAGLTSWFRQGARRPVPAPIACQVLTFCRHSRNGR